MKKIEDLSDLEWDYALKLARDGDQSPLAELIRDFKRPLPDDIRAELANFLTDRSALKKKRKSRSSQKGWIIELLMSGLSAGKVSQEEARGIVFEILDIPEDTIVSYMRKIKKSR